MSQSGSLSTGDEVLDRMLRGGIPENRAILVRGGPGTGKTTFGMQFLQAGLEAGDQCLFVSTEQTREELYGSFADHAFDLGHENLTVTTLHPSPRQDSSDGQQLTLRTLEGDSVIDSKEIPFTVTNVARYFQSSEDTDRLVLDSVSALRAVTDNSELFRRQLLELIRVFCDRMDATPLFTAEASERDSPLSFTTHGVLGLHRERIDDDPHRFLEIEKMRGTDHDHRTMEYTLSEDGLDVGPARRSQPPELKTHKHTSVGIDGLDSLCGGGLATGAGVLLEHDGHANLTALFGALFSRAVELDAVLVLVPTIRMRPSSVRRILDGHDVAIDDLFENDRLFVLDRIGAWDESRENVYTPCNTAEEFTEVFEIVNERAGDDRRFSVVNSNAVIDALGEDDARQSRYALEADWVRPDDLLLHVQNPQETSEKMRGFYTNAAEQVLRTWITENGLQYVSLGKSPCGFVGTTSMVEYTTEPPYLEVQSPPEERENPYAE